MPAVQAGFTSHLIWMGRLTRLQLWRGQLYPDFTCLTALESRTLLDPWNGQGIFLGGQLSVLQPLQRLTSLYIQNLIINRFVYGLPRELGELAALCELAIVTGPLSLGGKTSPFSASLTSLTRLTKLAVLEAHL
jgi:hypothetical protein